MVKAVVVRGRLSDSRHVELDEPVIELAGATVEVFLRECPRRDVFDVIASFPSGTRTRDDIDRQIREERATWDKR